MNSRRVVTGPVTHPFDWLIIGYSLLMVLVILILGRPLGDYTSEIVFYLGMACIAAIIARYVREEEGRLQAFVRLLYPVCMFTFFYRQTGGLMYLVFDQFLDWQLVTFETLILGTNLTLYLDSHFSSIGLNEIFAFCYFSYYLMLPAFFIPVFVRKDYDIVKQCLTAVCLTFFVSYFLFFLYPVEGPRWHFAGQYLNQIDGPVFTKLVAFVIDNAAVRGGAMPSSHTGVAVVIMLYCFRFYRRAGWVLLPIVTGLALGTVWGRFHYASDVVVGVAIGVFAERLIARYYDRWRMPWRRVPASKELKTQNVP